MLNKNPWWWAPPTWPERMVATSPSASLVSFLPNFPHLQYPIYSRGCWSTVLLIQGGLQLLTQDPSLKYLAWASKIQSQASWYFNHSLKNTTQAFKKIILDCITQASWIQPTQASNIHAQAWSIQPKASSIQQKPREFILFPRAGHVLASLFWLTRQRFTCLRQSRPAPPRYISGPIHRYTPHTVCGLHIAKSARLILAV